MKKILLSIATIGATGAILVTATFAFFNNVATSTGNVFAAGNLDLKLDDADEETPADGVTLSLNFTNLTPGQSQTGFVSLHNAGSVDIAENAFGADRTATVDNSDGSDLANVLDLSVKTGSDNTCATGTVDHTGAIATQLGDGFSPLTLKELENADYDSLPGITSGNNYFLCVTATLESGAGNQYNGDSVTDNMVFNAHQDVSQ